MCIRDSRPSARRITTPPRVPRPRPPPAVATARALAASPASTVPIPSDRDRPEPVGTPNLRLSPSLAFRPPQRSIWMPSALLPSHNSGIPPRAIRRLIGRGNNKPSLRAAQPCDTSLSAGRLPYQTTSCHGSFRTSTPPFRRFRSSLAKAGYTPPTTTPSYLSVHRPRIQRPTRSARWDARLAC